MDRSIPVGNRLCAKKVQDQKRERHLHKLTTMQAVLDNGVPVSVGLNHVRMNLKREQLMEDRYTEIDRTNQALLRKMSDIMQKPSMSVEMRNTIKPNHSLTRDSRRKELARITRDNFALLDRIQNVQPMYDRVNWEQDFRRSRGYMRNKCEYKPPMKAAASEKRMSPRLPAEILDNSGGSNQYVLKAGREIDGVYYLVEMYINGRNEFIINLYNNEIDELRIKLNPEEHRKLFSAVNGDYRNIEFYLNENNEIIINTKF